ncbi:quinolinate synthase NadA [Saccharolobus islandicus]|uniref:Quinolinate synthase n=3 Tax=Saccharolobus islandicus TaxID=43080 RepID=F0NHD5_SACI5|nr:quinolinate synthase NadA [Sulfolobus islandicus]ACR41812.1 quinolinate synthetase complex, A subunit [Sulfolobus islandicus M.16.4]ADX82520.1 quinolinate synthetase complex, A subunit [Sulfolobus islandicus HVE10/4]ADX85156.1 quinolinate synthetase complex, A subunit [Sulfolobus islandicus REY15A]WCM36196.1 quinolinate synthase NadA [Sulfolobus islandicus]
MTRVEELLSQIKKLKTEKNAIILGHNYMEYSVQLVSDFTGDSYDLAVKAMKTNAKIIIFAGVYFMAEQASALNPEKKVLSPEPSAGCTLSDVLDVKTLQEYKEMYPNAPVVLYINTSIHAKALADYIVTSSTAVKVVKKLNADTILFGPDANLANYVQQKVPNKKIIKVPPNGRCIVHANYTKQLVELARKKYPNALLMAHPEAPLEILESADFVGSTNQMIQFSKENKNEEFIVATEIGMINALKIKNPSKKFYPLVTTEACACARCPYMNMITLEKVKRSLEEEVYEVKVPEDIAERAKIAFENTMKLLE